ncbi:unnamed protein product [Phaeothamnion confervicola]
MRVADSDPGDDTSANASTGEGERREDQQTSYMARRNSETSEVTVDLAAFELEAGDSLTKDYSPGRSSLWGAVFNFTNTIVGAGIIGIPFAVYQCGMVAGILLILLAAFFTERSSIMLIVSGERVGRLNYEELMQVAFGSVGYYVFCFFAFVMAFGAMCAYLIIIGDTIPQIVNSIHHSGGGDDDSSGSSSSDEFLGADRQRVIALFSVLVLLPISCLREMHSLAVSSFLSVLSDVLIVVIVLFTAPAAAESAAVAAGVSVDRAGAFNVLRPTVFAGFGAISFAFVSQSSSFLLYRSLADRGVAAWVSVTRRAVGMATVMVMGLALSGYFAFVDTTEGDVLNNFPADSVAANAARGFLAITMVFTYPMEMFVARHVADVCCFQRLAGRGPTTMPRHAGWTLLVWLATTTVALSTDDLGVVLEVFGAFSASAIGYVMPACLYLKAHERDVAAALAAWRPGDDRHQASLAGRLRALRPWYTPAFMAFFGTVAMVAGIATVIYDKMHGERSGRR